MKIDYLILLLFCHSCSNLVNTNPKELYPTKLSVQLNCADSLILPLAIDVHNITPTSFVHNNIFTFYANRKLVSYDINTADSIKTIPIRKNDIGALSCLQMKNFDSIYIVDYYYKDIARIDSNGIVQERFHIPKEVHLPITSITPIFLKNNKIIITNYSIQDCQTFSVYNMSNLTAKNLQSYPLLYRNNWGCFLLRLPSVGFNDEKKTYAVSYPADHYIYIFDENLNLLSVRYAGSNRIDNTTAISDNPAQMVDNDTEERHFNTTSSYSNILYDKYRKVYYRMAELANTDFSFSVNTLHINHKIISIITLDEDFNIIGESIVKESSMPSFRFTVFVSEKGLCIQRPSSEDYMEFNIYKLQNI